MTSACPQRSGARTPALVTTQCCIPGVNAVDGIEICNIWLGAWLKQAYVQALNSDKFELYVLQRRSARVVVFDINTMCQLLTQMQASACATVEILL
jgi:hypothetical protein